MLEREVLGERARVAGNYRRQRLHEVLSNYEMVKEIRGVGLLNGIEFTAPRKISLRIPFEAFMKIHPGMFGQVLVMRLFRDKGMLTKICGNNFMVLKGCTSVMGGFGVGLFFAPCLTALYAVRCEYGHLSGSPQSRTPTRR